MTQILLYKGRHGISLATDSKAVAFVPDKKMEHMTVQKIFVLSSYAVLVTGGAGYGVLACERFQAHIKSQGQLSFEVIREQTVPYLREQINRIHAENIYAGERPDLERVYFLLAGFVPDSTGDPYRFELFGCEHFRDPLHPIETTQVVAIPRQMGIEFRLSRLPGTPSELEDVQTICEKFLIKLARETEEVGPPFYFVRIASDGIKVRTQELLD